MIHFSRVTEIADLKKYYPILEEACSRITRRQSAEAFAPDVYAALLNGKAELVVGFRDGELKGFFTCYVIERPCGSRSLHIWHGYIRPGDPPNGLIAAFYELENVARQKGCTELVFGTQRKGWSKVAARVGMKLRDYTFQKDIK